MCGVAPDGLTLRELDWMAGARLRSEWARTSASLALMVNLARDPRKGRPAKPSDFDPFAMKAPKPVLKGRELEVLARVFVRGETEK